MTRAGTKVAASPRPRLRPLGRRLLAAALTRYGWTKSPPPRPVPGAVDEFSWKLAAGWVAVPSGTPPVRITLHIGKVEIAGAWAARPGPVGALAGAAAGVPPGELDGGAAGGVALKDRLELRPFRFKVRGIWEYAKRSHRITVRAGGHPLPIVGHGMFLRPKRNGRGTPAEASALLATGHVFAQTGYLQLSRKLDLAWQGEVLGLHEGVCQVLREHFGYDAFVIYGSLLGAVREGGFIGHDIDFDAAYVSRHSDPAAVAAEMGKVALRLIDDGFEVESLRSALHIHAKSDPAIRIDLFHLFFDSGGVLSFPFGVAGTREVRVEEWTGLEPRPFASAQVLAPVCAEAVVEAIYGPTWREPQPGFSWTLDKRTRAEAALAPIDGLRRVYWANRHARSGTTGPSPFFAAIDARADTPAVVIDVGCGDGRDALAFGQAGRAVLGLDRCAVGLRRAQERADLAEVADRVRFRACEFAAADQARSAFAEALAGAGDAPVLFYARFLFHALDAEVQEVLLTEIAAAARPGDLFATEFRVSADAALPKVHNPRIGRRFQDGPALGRRLAADGFELLDEVEGRGLSPYGDEDPVLYRLVARRR